MGWETQLCTDMGEWEREAGVPVSEGGWAGGSTVSTLVLHPPSRTKKLKEGLSQESSIRNALVTGGTGAEWNGEPWALSPPRSPPLLPASESNLKAPFSRKPTYK